ncbi:MAG: RNA methyltransferase [Oscillospiraceae bacterium]|nr:RNA methyltransferase [Oscillospiraceae bacterium]
MTEIITSRQNKTVKYIRALSRERELRHEKSEFVCDGEKLLREAISEKREIVTALFSAEKYEALPEVPGAEVLRVSQDVLDSITTLKNAQDVIFTCKMKKTEQKQLSRVILLDRLQDTGNLGTIIRTADALGIDAVFEDGCADVYNPKTVRSAMGSLFRVPVISADFTELIPKLRANGINVYASELYGDVKTISDIGFERAAVVIGNEGNGVRRDISALCNASVIIPMRGGAESLNASVAAAIFMYKMSENR